ncbi:ferric reductase-like transmembrane domain-containing protein [Microbacterium sp. IEGM 1404]|uniref:ferric reductase-like transmembrane domain-containing protein n=1 Tax=Microbacterium sp. IEGM 1404 TaxID=3047084 RepID=UPI0024B8041B|nr:ferric reductase-like transmembrane domain-containing protein [Microbacterium sp. IEGM 1404]MDI9889639.1 ferric reductase-like transmembrane domain-containing protein [Microbacterium sp. IEGM 1404]
MDEALWALGRGTGVVGLVLLSLAVVGGIVVRSGAPLPGLGRFGAARLHRDIALLATVFIGIHLVSLLFDSYAQLDVVDFFVPFLAAYRPVWLGLGTLAIDLVLAVVVTALLRHRIGARVFRFVHRGTYLLWPLALAHAIGAGTDAAEPWFLVTVAACAVAVAAAVSWRLVLRARERRAADPVAPVERPRARVGVAS